MKEKRVTPADCASGGSGLRGGCTARTCSAGVPVGVGVAAGCGGVCGGAGCACRALTPAAPASASAKTTAATDEFRIPFLISESPASDGPRLARGERFERQRLERCELEGVGAAGAEPDRRSAALVPPGAAPDVGPRGTRRQLEDLRGVERDLLRPVRRVAQDEDALARRPGGPAVDFELQRVA